MSKYSLLSVFALSTALAGLCVSTLPADTLDIPGFSYRGDVPGSAGDESAAIVGSPDGDVYYVASRDGRLVAYRSLKGESGFSAFDLAFSGAAPQGVRDVKAFNRFADDWMVFYVASAPEGGEGLYSLSIGEDTGLLRNDGIRYDEDKGDASSIERYEILRDVLRSFTTFAIKPSYTSMAYINGYDGKAITSTRSIVKTAATAVGIMSLDEESLCVVGYSVVDEGNSLVTVTGLPHDGSGSSVTISVPAASTFARMESVWAYEGDTILALYLANATVMVGHIDGTWRSLVVPYAAASVVPNGLPFESLALIADDGKVISIPADISGYAATTASFPYDAANSLYVAYDDKETTIDSIIHGFSSASGAVVESVLTYDADAKTWVASPSEADYSAYISVSCFYIEEDIALVMARIDGAVDIRFYSEDGAMVTSVLSAVYNSSTGIALMENDSTQFLWPYSEKKTGWKIAYTDGSSPNAMDLSITLDLTREEYYIRVVNTITADITRTAVYAKIQ